MPSEVPTAAPTPQPTIIPSSAPTPLPTLSRRRLLDDQCFSTNTTTIITSYVVTVVLPAVELPVYTGGAGSVVEVAFGLAANHGGGYQYRLCPADATLDEECFQKTPLPFVGDTQWASFGSGEGVRRVAFRANRTDDALWTKDPIPACAHYGGGGAVACWKNWLSSLAASVKRFAFL